MKDNKIKKKQDKCDFENGKICTSNFCVYTYECSARDKLGYPNRVIKAEAQRK